MKFSPLKKGLVVSITDLEDNKGELFNIKFQDLDKEDLVEIIHSLDEALEKMPEK